MNKTNDCLHLSRLESAIRAADRSGFSCETPQTNSYTDRPALVSRVAALRVVLLLLWCHPAPGQDKPIQEEVNCQVQRVSKIFGRTHEWDTRAGIRVLNDGFKGVLGTDLGPMTLYKGKLWFNLGDTNLENEKWDPRNDMNFIVAFTSDTRFIDGIEVEGYLNCRDRPRTALAPKPAYPIPNAMFTVTWQDTEHMFAQYMEVEEVGGHDHHIHKSRIARYSDGDEVFRPYKPEVYQWEHEDAPKTHFHFGMASFLADSGNEFLYMIGSPPGRFGGVKLARIPVRSFVDAEDKRPWQYFMGAGRWSEPTRDEKVIGDAVWLIPPKDPEWNLEKDYDNLPWSEQGKLITIAEFCVVYNPYLERFMLITGRPCPAESGGGVWYYTAGDITGPWSDEKLLMANSDDAGLKWSYYGTYTTDALLERDGRTMYFVATTWEPYSIYLYRARFVRQRSRSR